MLLAVALQVVCAHSSIALPPQLVWAKASNFISEAFAATSGVHVEGKIAAGLRVVELSRRAVGLAPSAAVGHAMLGVGKAWLESSLSRGTTKPNVGLEEGAAHISRAVELLDLYLKSMRSPNRTQQSRQQMPWYTQRQWSIPYHPLSFELTVAMLSEYNSNLAVILTDLHRGRQQAGTLHARALSLRPNSAIVLQNLGRFYMHHSAWQQAFSTFDKLQRTSTAPSVLGPVSRCW